MTFVSEKGISIDVECAFNTADKALGLKQSSVIVNDDDEEKILAELDR